MGSKVIALAVADIHLSHDPPVARSVEPDWYAAQGRVLEQLENLRQKYRCPILCAGDIFDRYYGAKGKNGPTLINWAIENLPPMIAIPGQHDLPYHDLGEIEKSAYWTLVKAGVIQNMPGDESLFLATDVETCFYPWGVEVGEKRNPEVCVAHKYVWMRGSSYPGAPEKAHINTMEAQLDGYKVAIFGDNHKGFHGHIGECEVVNCGCLIPRKSDERGYEPSVTLIHENLKLSACFLDTSQDKWIEEVDLPVVEDVVDGLEDFVAELGGLDADSLDYRAAINRFMDENKVSSKVRNILLEAMEE